MDPYSSAAEGTVAVAPDCRVDPKVDLVDHAQSATIRPRIDLETQLGKRPQGIGICDGDSVVVKALNARQGYNLLSWSLRLGSPPKHVRDPAQGPTDATSDGMCTLARFSRAADVSAASRTRFASS